MIDRVVQGKPEAAATTLGPRVREEANASVLRKQGVSRALVAFVAAAALFHFDRLYAGSVAGMLGAVTLGLALLSPTRGYSALTRAIDRVGVGVGTLLSWILLAPIFYLVLAPFGLLTRRGRGDPLQRVREPSLPSYWRVRPEETRETERARLERPY